MLTQKTFRASISISKKKIYKMDIYVLKAINMREW